MSKRIGIGLLGTGTVGNGVIELLRANCATIAARSGYEFYLAAACSRNTERAQQRVGQDVQVVSDWRAVIEHPNCDIVVELIGGTDTAHEIATATLQAGKQLVTANKALLATHGVELFETARKYESNILFEAAVAGCIPAIRVLRHSLAADQINSVCGIINGTCNYILTRMRDTGMDFATALAEASELGYAEADPTLDIDGWDAAHKATIMAWLAFGTPLTLEQIPVSGVRHASVTDENYAKLFGYTLKLIALAQAHPSGVEAWVNLALVADDSKLARIDHNLNAVLIDTQACGELLLVGAGAGAAPTAAAVLSDVIEAASGLASLPPLSNGTKLLGPATTARESYLRLRVIDSKGVVAKISAQLADAGISIEAMHQGESRDGEETDIALLLHKANWQQVCAVTESLAATDDVKSQPVLLPIAISRTPLTT